MTLRVDAARARRLGPVGVRAPAVTRKLTRPDRNLVSVDAWNEAREATDVVQIECPWCEGDLLVDPVALASLLTCPECMVGWDVTGAPDAELAQAA